MKLLSEIIMIIVTLSFVRLFNLDNRQRIDSISEIVVHLLYNSGYATVHFDLNSVYHPCMESVSDILSLYDGPVIINAGNYNKGDSVIMILDWNMVISMTYDHLEEVGMLVLIVHRDDATQLSPSIPTKLLNSMISKIAIVAIAHSSNLEATDAHITIIDRIKTRNCKLIKTVVQSLNQSSITELNVTNTSAGHSSKNFKGCSVDVGIVLLAPFTVSHQKPNAAEYSGLEVDLLRVLASYFNFSIQLTPPQNGMKWGELRKYGSTGLMGMLQEGNVDFAIGSIGRSLARNTMLKAGVGNFYDHVIFAVPPGIPYGPMEKLTMPVSSNAWIFIIATFIVFSLLFSIDVSKQNFRIKLDKQNASFIYAWSVLFGGAMHNSSKVVFKRYVLIGWLSATLVLRNAYQAILFNNLRRGIEFEPILSLEDIDKAGLYYYMYNITQRFFVRNPHILKRSVIVKDDVSLQGILDDIADNKLKAAFPLPRSNVAFFNKQRLFRSKVHVSQYIIETYEVAIHYPIGSPLTELFDEVVLRVRAGGLHEYWMRQFQGPKLDRSIELKKLSLHSLLGVLMIYGIFCGCCCICFAAEIIVDKIKNLH
ncbi:hypothetical protein RP20_CCG019124 [Aedes albopictus]|nr:hypothetical protein RP20_CCG019124 [Aedes albopictus]